MATIKSNIPEVAERYFKGLEKQVEAAVHRAMVKTAMVGESRVKGIMAKEAYDTGRLLRSVTSTIYRSKDFLRLVIGSNLDYALFIEEGRKPGKWPNLNAMVKWVGRKLRRQGVNTNVNLSFDQLKAAARTGGNKASVKQIAYRKHLGAVYLIGRAIATRGIRQRLIFKRLEAGLLAYFRAQAAKELKSIC